VAFTERYLLQNEKYTLCNVFFPLKNVTKCCVKNGLTALFHLTKNL